MSLLVALSAETRSESHLFLKIKLLGKNSREDLKKKKKLRMCCQLFLFLLFSKDKSCLYAENIFYFTFWPV